MAELQSSLLNPDMDEIEQQLGFKRMELERQGLSKADIEVQLSIERAKLMLMTEPSANAEGEEGKKETLLGGSEFWKIMSKLRREEQKGSMGQAREYSRERILKKLRTARELDPSKQWIGTFYNKSNWVELEEELDEFIKLNSR